MSDRWRMMWVAFAGVVVGAAGMGALLAQTAERPAFLVANIQSVKDQAVYDRYRAAVSATHAQVGGRFIVRGAEPVILDASLKPTGTIVIVAFPSMAKLREWWNSPSYGAIKGLRESGTVSQLYAVEGWPGA